MTKREHWRYEMLIRLRDFGRTHNERFSAFAGAVKTFDALDRAISQIDQRSETTRTMGKERRPSRLKTRRELYRRLVAIKRTATDWGKAEVGADTHFGMPQTRADYDLETSARVFIEAAAAGKPAFLARGMPETFIDDLRLALAEFSRVRQEAHNAWYTRVIDRENRRVKLDDGLRAAQTLDIIVANACADDPVLLATWKEARRVPRSAPRVAAKPAVVPPEQTAGV